MPVTAKEKAWIASYRKELNRLHPRLVTRMLLFGSKARGDDHADSDLDVLLIIKDEAAALKRKLREVGYELAATGEAVPSIIAYTENEWQLRKQSGSPFRHAVERDAREVLN